MHTRGQVSRPKSVGIKLEVPAQTVRYTHHKGNAVATVIIGPKETRLDLRVGVAPHDPELVALDDYLHERAGVPSDDDFVAMLDRVPSYGGGMTPELARLASDWLRAPRTGRPGKGANAPAECFLRLVIALGIPAESHEASPARALAKRVQKARKKLR